MRRHVTMAGVTAAGGVSMETAGRAVVTAADGVSMETAGRAVVTAADGVSMETAGRAVVTAADGVSMETAGRAVVTAADGVSVVLNPGWSRDKLAFDGRSNSRRQDGRSNNCSPAPSARWSVHLRTCGQQLVNSLLASSVQAPLVEEACLVPDERLTLVSS